jgi:hypothetical protein
MPPPDILNAPTKLMKDIGYGKGYAYDHEAKDGFSGADYWPEEHGAAEVLPPDRPRFRGAGEGTAGILGRAAQVATVEPIASRGVKRCTKWVERTAIGRAQLMHWGPKILIAL